NTVPNRPISLVLRFGPRRLRLRAKAPLSMALALTPMESALAKTPVRKSFRIRTCEKTRTERSYVEPMVASRPAEEALKEKRLPPKGSLFSQARICLVAGDGFGGLFALGGVAVGGAVAFGGRGRAEARPYMGFGYAIAVAIGWGDVDRLVAVGEVGWDGFGDVGQRADLDYGWLGLLEDEFFVDGADFGLFLVGLFAASALFLGSGQRNV